MKSFVGKRGRLTIPKALRERLGINPGTELEFTESQGNLVARIAEPDPLNALVGLLPRMDVDAALRKLRGRT